MIEVNNHKIFFQVETGPQGYLELLNRPITVAEEPGYLWSLDVAIYRLDKAEKKTPKDHGFPILSFPTNSSVARFLASNFASSETGSASFPISARFIFSFKNGYAVRSDFLEQRLECSQFISSVVSFLDPLQQVVGIGLDTGLSDLMTLFSRAVGAVTRRSSASFQDLDVDMRNRLSFGWLQPHAISPHRLAWVQGREDIDCIERAFKAAAALGIKLVILDEPGHWLQDNCSPWAHLREAFIETDITADQGLASRIVDAVQSYPGKIDGVVTISDVRLASVARACHILGLPTENAEAYDIAGDKGRTRLLEPVGADESFVLSSAKDLQAYLETQEQSLNFPLVVKPVVGWCSDCVSKVQNLDQLTTAVQKASERHAYSAKPSTAVVVEPYIDGPEVDANFVILDGEVLFLDINDDFPSPADERSAEFKANFQETQNVMPSGLPEVELDAIREQMRDSILRQGFKSGVFHCEARVRNSSVRYSVNPGGIVDLVAGGDGAKATKPDVYLHEINARPPGYLESVAVLLTYGVDYYALRMLLALGREEVRRLRALSVPYFHGPQFHLSLMIIQQTRAGIMKTADAAKEFLDKHNDIKDNVVDYYTRKKGGDILEGPDADALWWIAYFSVISRVSRTELLGRVEYIQQNFEYEMEDQGTNGV